MRAFSERPASISVQVPSLIPVATGNGAALSPVRCHTTVPRGSACSAGAVTIPLLMLVAASLPRP